MGTLGQSRGGLGQGSDFPDHKNTDRNSYKKFSAIFFNAFIARHYQNFSKNSQFRKLSNYSHTFCVYVQMFYFVDFFNETGKSGLDFLKFKAFLCTNIVLRLLAGHIFVYGK